MWTKHCIWEGHTLVRVWARGPPDTAICVTTIARCAKMQSYQRAASRSFTHLPDVMFDCNHFTKYGLLMLACGNGRYLCCNKVPDPDESQCLF
jgi:hypothetical protein